LDMKLFLFALVGVSLAMPPSTTFMMKTADELLDTTCLASLDGGKWLGTMAHNYSYSCDECHRMTDALREHCKVHNNKLLGNIDMFEKSCRDYTYPVVFPNRTEGLEERCDHFTAFVLDVYCPLDPCVQISTQHYRTPDALCDLLRCNNPKVTIPFKPVVYPAPLTCPKYLKDTIDVCKRAMSVGSDGKKLTDVEFCNKYPANFTRDGCVEVVHRLETLAKPRVVCDILKCDSEPIDLNRLCNETLNLPVYKPVPVPGYITWLALINDVDLVFKNQGVNIVSATWGRNCSALEGNATSKDNLREYLQNFCSSKLKCKVPNPNMYELVPHAEGCDSEWELFYTCCDNCTQHRIFVPDDAPYDELKLDCTKEVRGFPELDEELFPYAHPQPMNEHAKMPVVHVDTSSVPASFNPADLQNYPAKNS